MITIKLGETYGCKSVEELMAGIKMLEELGLSHAEIDQILLRSETGKKFGVVEHETKNQDGDSDGR